MEVYQSELSQIICQHLNHGKYTSVQYSLIKIQFFNIYSCCRKKYNFEKFWKSLIPYGSNADDGNAITETHKKKSVKPKISTANSSVIAAARAKLAQLLPGI